jgi:heme-degrading monooxygenase HmoA
MAPKQSAKKGAKSASTAKVYDYSGLKKDMKVQIESEGEWYAGKIVQLSSTNSRAKAPVKVTYTGYSGYDEWLGGDRLKCKALKTQAATTSTRRPRMPVRFVTEGEIPIGRVARVYRAKVKGEAEALRLDALMNEFHSKLSAAKKDQAKGFVKMSRAVCKTEWAYECTVIWRSLADFEAYRASAFRKEVSGEFEEQVKELIVGDLYSGVRCYDELPPGNCTSSTKAQNVDTMVANQGFDVTIICTGDEHQAAYWTKKLEKEKGNIVPSKSTVIAVDEDWNGGAGNFLGTLYAWKKACDALKKKGRDLRKELEKGASVALFHTAGKGTRLAPLPGAENNNKPGVRLPASGGISILESVIRQTGAYAKSRKGRFSVFWGDQVFVPSIPARYEPKHHADILCGLGPMPNAEEWKQKGLQSYGCIAASKDNTVLAQLEKVTHEVATERLAKFDVDRVGASLGSFSLSEKLLSALMDGFSNELEAKTGSMDSDPHLWMALTLDSDAYASMMKAKGHFEESAAKEHKVRVMKIIDEFDKGDMPGIFGAVNVGSCSWWDYGQLKLYLRGALLLTENSEDAFLARRFFGVGENSRVSKSKLGKCEVDDRSVISGTQVSDGSVSASAICNVKAASIQADGAVLMQVSANKIIAGKGSICYNVIDESEAGITLADNEVRVGIFDAEGKYFEMKSEVSTDGGKAWKEKVHGNAKSFEDVHTENKGANVSACARAAAEKHRQFKLSA